MIVDRIFLYIVFGLRSRSAQMLDYAFVAKSSCCPDAIPTAQVLVVVLAMLVNYVALALRGSHISHGLHFPLDDIDIQT
jgi:hypothetical protein